VPTANSAKVPVYSLYGKVEDADAARVRQLRDAPNVEFVKRHKDGCLMRIMLYAHGDDYGRRSRYGNPQTDIYDAESADNPKNVWAFKRQCGTAATEPQS
jgi:hypothetical protein